MAECPSEDPKNGIPSLVFGVNRNCKTMPITAKLSAVIYLLDKTEMNTPTPNSALSRFHMIWRGAFTDESHQVKVMGLIESMDKLVKKKDERAITVTVQGHEFTGTAASLRRWMILLM